MTIGLLVAGAVDHAPSAAIAPRSAARLATGPTAGPGEGRTLVFSAGEQVADLPTPREGRGVLVQLVDPPLAALAAGRSREARRQRAREIDDVAVLVARLENAARATQGLAALPQETIVERRYGLVFNGLAARIGPDAIAAVEKLPQVKKVWADPTVSVALDDSVPLIRADRVWQNVGSDGSGVTIAVVDTGIDYTHPDLGGCLGPACKVRAGYDFFSDDPDPMDQSGHGTHVAGIAAANGAVRGVAPGASLLAVRVLGSVGTGSASGVIAGIEWAVDPDGDPETDDGADVINLSLGFPDGSPDDPLSQAATGAVLAGVVVVAAAGNEGPEYETIRSPGLADRVLTVGATDLADVVASFSSRGPVAPNWAIKPEVMAPGVGITSTVPDGGCAFCDPGGLLALSGTSMAAPHVAGTAALLLETFPAWTPDQVKNAIAESTVTIAGDPFARGSGRIDAFAAATARVLVDRANIALGLDPIEVAQAVYSETLVVSNVTSGALTYTVSTAGSLPAGVVVAVDPTSLQLGPGATGAVTFDLSVDNAAVANLPDPPHAYHGTLRLDGPGSVDLPFAFLKSPRLELSFPTPPDRVAVHDRAHLTRLLAPPSASETLLVAEGSYDVIATWDASRTRVVRELVTVETVAALEIDPVEAIHALTLVPTGSDGAPLSFDRGVTLSNFGFVPVYTELSSAGAFDGTFRFSSMSETYAFEAARLEDPGAPGEPQYVFYAWDVDGITAPTTFENAPDDLRRLVTRHSPAPGVGALRSATALSSTPLLETVLGASRGCEEGLPALAAPFEEVTYLMPRPYPGYSVGFLNRTAYRQAAEPCRESDLLHVTPYLVADDAEQVSAYLGLDGTPVYTAAHAVVPAGLGPDVWNGKFRNRMDRVLVQPARGRGLVPFLTQTGDRRAADPVPYELRRGASTVQVGTLEAFGPLLLDATVVPGGHELRVTYGGFHLGSARAKAHVAASFDTRRADPDPPALVSLHLLAGGEHVDLVPAAGAEVRFRVDEAVGQIELLHDPGDGFEPLPLTTIAPGEFGATIPPFAGGPGWVPLHLSITDIAGNRLVYDVCAAGAIERCGDGVDGDCDGADLACAPCTVDADGDGHVACDAGCDAGDGAGCDCDDSIAWCGDDCSADLCVANHESTTLAVLADQNGNGAPELATLFPEASGPAVVVNDAGSGARLARIEFATDLVPLALLAIEDLGGTPAQELALVGLQGESVVAQLRDAASGAVVGNVFFGPSLAPRDVAVLEGHPAAAGPVLALLGVDRGSGQPMVRLKPAAGGAAIGTVPFLSGHPVVALAASRSFAETDAPELVVLSRRDTTGETVVQIRDSASAKMIRNILFFSIDAPSALEVLDTFPGVTDPVIAVLGHDTAADAVLVRLKEACVGCWVRALGTHGSYPPAELGIAADYAGGPGPEVALAGESAEDGTVLVQLKDLATAGVVGNVFYGSSHSLETVRVLASFAGTAAPEIAVLGKDRTSGEIRIQIRDAGSRQLINSLFPERE